MWSYIYKKLIIDFSKLTFLLIAITLVFPIFFNKIVSFNVRRIQTMSELLYRKCWWNLENVGGLGLTFKMNFLIDVKKPIGINFQNIIKIFFI